LVGGVVGFGGKWLVVSGLGGKVVAINPPSSFPLPCIAYYHPLPTTLHR
jgi:hypothetical protein